MSAGKLSSVAVTEFDTVIGRCAMGWTDDGVVRFQLPEVVRAAEATRSSASAQTSDADALTAGMLRRGVDPIAAERVRVVEPSGAMAEAIRAVRAHLTGELDDLRWIPVDYRAQPEFHRAVYDITRTIAPGRTLTYGEVAARAGAPGAAQAVGQALGRNPVPLIVPCHRVLAADHGLHGFSAPGGIVTKARLLEIERTSGFGEPTLF
ncbi:methylated-DNA--[protein]-cysteine S-methyltransferase [Nocardia africana]|uniref:Methylated-DNA--protein-cysteine methyltransferase n=1 Tax=Nocardia africana TaxID=134964 RepID=A0A378X6W3_9NOCA|nr:methylated-DNA--[protein]-cysteine S-methyltransferase [Nocardia africana]MCC3317715.1 methylated-DNA--[protein]-cysteine S-methyltransferase [Nocardia africana]SUA48474.1 Methylated-DNA--protein-cysteine methyltransferase [Nocardia africana]